jgi:hypothetical protein
MFATMGAAMIAYAALIAWTGHITVSSKHGPAHTYTGSEALSWAALTACFGLALFGPLFARSSFIASWMTLWIVAGIAIGLVPVYWP